MVALSLHSPLVLLVRLSLTTLPFTKDVNFWKDFCSTSSFTSLPRSPTKILQAAPLFTTFCSTPETDLVAEGLLLVLMETVHEMYAAVSSGIGSPTYHCFGLQE